MIATPGRRDLVAVGPGRPAVVRIAAAGRPELTTQVTLGTFDGPIALLLSLIEQRELDVRTVPLGDLAGAYLEALSRLSGDRIAHITAFVAVAAQLILIKSRAMLPEPPPPPERHEEDAASDPAEDLRQRLILYRAHRDAATLLGARLAEPVALRHREAAAASASGLSGARPPASPPLDPLTLRTALDGLARLAPPPEPPPEVVPRTVTMHERASVIRAALRDAPALVLQDLLRGVADRVVVAVTFLALLELVKRRELVVEQERPWGPIICRSRPATTAGP